MPFQDILRESGVQHVAMNIPAVPHGRVIRTGGRPQIKDGRTQKRRHNLDPALLVIWHWSETQGQDLGRAPGDHPREHIQSIMSRVAGAGEPEVLVQEEKLVPKAHHRRFQAAESVAHRAEYVVEIDHYIRAYLLQPS